MKNIRLEYLNMLTGILLCLVGILYGLKSEYEMALNWLIFGSMYLVMDEYKISKIAPKKLEEHVRVVFAFSGLGFSIALLLYKAL